MTLLTDIATPGSGGTEMTIRQLAAFLGIRLATAYGLVWDGTVAAVKQDGA